MHFFIETSKLGSNLKFLSKLTEISEQMFFFKIGTFLGGAPKEIQTFIFFFHHPTLPYLSYISGQANMDQKWKLRSLIMQF